MRTADSSWVGSIGSPTMLYRGPLDGFKGPTLGPDSTGVPQVEQNAARSAKAAPQLKQNFGIDRALGFGVAYTVQRNCSTRKFSAQ